MKLTDKQRAVLEFIRDEIQEKQRPPTMREIVAHFGFKSPKAASDHVEALERKGFISREKGRARSIRPLKDNIKGIPLYGHIPAGIPEDGKQHEEGDIHIDAQTLGFPITKQVFALRVRGDSMINRGIFDGDTAIIDGALRARNNDVVAALIDNETTLKTIILQENGCPYLKAENPAYSDLVPTSELVIQGVARAIIRNMV